MDGRRCRRRPLAHPRRRRVDLVIERDDGSVVAIEVKAGTRVSGRDLAGLRVIRDELGDAFLVRPDPLHAFHMQKVYADAMSTTVVQVRDIPDAVVATLKRRAEQRGQSLTAYLRDLLTQEASQPSTDEVMASIASRTPIDYSSDQLRALIEDGRR
jgi:plasmid stability protein